MEITCIRVDAYEHQDRVLLNSRQIIPTPEVEEYLTRRQEKERRQSETRRGRTINALLDSGALESGQQVVYNPDQVPKSIDREYDPLNEFWQAEVTGNTGQSNNVRWLHNGKTYSFTGLTKELLNELIDRDRGLALNGYNYWIQPDYDRTLADLRDEPVRAE